MIRNLFQVYIIKFFSEYYVISLFSEYVLKNTRHEKNSPKEMEKAFYSF